MSSDGQRQPPERDVGIRSWRLLALAVMGPTLTDGVGGSSVARCATGGAPRVGNARRAAAETVVRGFISRAGLFRGQPARPLAAHELNARARTQRDRAHGSIVSGVNGHLASRAAAVGPWPGKASQGAVAPGI